MTARQRPGAKGVQGAQVVTPALRQWIVEQAEAGFTPQAVLRSMQASGWDEDVAIQAMEDTLNAHLAARAPRAATAQPPTPVPEPDLSGAPLYIDAGDRRVAVLQVVREPRIVVFGGLLSDEECAQLVELARPRLSRSLTVSSAAGTTGADGVSPERTSQGMFFDRGEHPLVARIEQRLARLVNWPVECGEGLQILQYRPGTEYKPHYDYFDPAEPGTPTILKRGGQRVATFILYLAEPEQGGATAFPDLGLEVAPKRGHAVFFSYARPHPSTRSLHGGAPVLAGEKWIATKWLRERPFT